MHGTTQAWKLFPVLPDFHSILPVPVISSQHLAISQIHHAMTHYRPEKHRFDIFRITVIHVKQHDAKIFFFYYIIGGMNFFFLAESKMRRELISMNFIKQRCITAAVLLLVAILSITVVGKYVSAPENHQKTIASLDEKKQTVMELTAASTVTSALITLLPGDTATPIAEKMADVSGYLLVVLCAIYLEKYLVTITGYVAFTYLIPIACGLWMLNLIFANATVRKLAAKLAVFGLAISLVVPASVKISDLIGDTYQAQIEATIEDAKNTQNILENSGVVDDTNATETTGTGTTEASGTVTGNVQEKENNNSGSVSNIFDWAKDAISGAKDSVANVVENVTVSTEELVQKVENSLNHFIEAVAVMIITSCVIPMLVLLLFFWMVKIVLDVDLSGVKIKGMLPERKE